MQKDFDVFEAVRSGKLHGQIDKGRCADRNQHVGSQPRRAQAILPFGPDQRAEHKRRRQADERIEEIVGLECRQKAHNDCLPGQRGGLQARINSTARFAD